MTRRYKPTRVGISHSDTRFAEFKRESSRPRPDPAPVVPTEPSPAPTPPPSRPKTILVKALPPDGTVVMQPQEARAVRAALRAAEAQADQSTQAAIRKARATLNDATRGHL